MIANSNYFRGIILALVTLAVLTIITPDSVSADPARGKSAKSRGSTKQLLDDGNDRNIDTIPSEGSEWMRDYAARRQKEVQRKVAGKKRGRRGKKPAELEEEINHMPVMPASEYGGHLITDLAYRPDEPNQFLQDINLIHKSFHGQQKMCPPGSTRDFRGTCSPTVMLFNHRYTDRMLNKGRSFDNIKCPRGFIQHPDNGACIKWKRPSSGSKRRRVKNWEDVLMPATTQKIYHV